MVSKYSNEIQSLNNIDEGLVLSMISIHGCSFDDDDNKGQLSTNVK
jgi:hypothetical protein